jgi:hypothetical protein
MRTIALLTVSNIFMTFAWYGHLKYRDVPLFKVIVISWMIAFFEYCFQVPANRIGSYEFSGATQDYSGSDYAGGVLRVFGVLPEAAGEVEPRRRIRDDRGCRGSDLQAVVSQARAFFKTAICPA